MQDFDKLWNYNDPAATEIKFREALLNSMADQDLSYHLQLLTQIARTYSLRAMFTEAHNLLNDIEKQLPEQPAPEHVRYNLERGRTFNSSGKKVESKEYFEKAKQLSSALKDDFYTIDAIHMLAIVSTADKAIKLNEEAIILSEETKDENAKRWLGSLYNNLGWSYFDKGEYEKALSIFLRALKWREDRKSAGEIFLAKWCVGRTLRALARFDDAIKIQLALFEEAITVGVPDGYVHEELGELFLLKNDKLKSSFHFEKAYELLSQDKFLQQFEKERLERMRQLKAQ